MRAAPAPDGIRCAAPRTAKPGYIAAALPETHCQDREPWPSPVSRPSGSEKDAHGMRCHGQRQIAQRGVTQMQRSPKKRRAQERFASREQGRLKVGGSPIYRSFVAGLAATFSILCGLGLGQDPQVLIEPRPVPRHGPTGEADRVTPHLRVDTELVLIPVMVTDSENRLVTGLVKEHFKLYDNKVEQVITHITRYGAVSSAGLRFECSGSRGAKLKKTCEGVSAFM